MTPFHPCICFAGHTWTQSHGQRKEGNLWIFLLVCICGEISADRELNLQRSLQKTDLRTKTTRLARPAGNTQIHWRRKRFISSPLCLSHYMQLPAEGVHPGGLLLKPQPTRMQVPPTQTHNRPRHRHRPPPPSLTRKKHTRHSPHRTPLAPTHVLCYSNYSCLSVCLSVLMMQTRDCCKLLCFLPS